MGDSLFWQHATLSFCIVLLFCCIYASYFVATKVLSQRRSDGVGVGMVNKVQLQEATDPSPGGTPSYRQNPLYDSLEFYASVQ